MSCTALKSRPAFTNKADAAHRTILIVDDNEDVRRLAAFSLRLAGYTVLEAADGERAIQISEERDGPIDLVLTDERMPRMSGHTAAKRLRIARPGIKVLFMSGYIDGMTDEDEPAIIEMNFLPKPFTPRLLIDRVKAMLRRN